MTTYGQFGVLDNSFGVGGVVTTDFGKDEYGSSVAIQDDGKIIVCGQIYDYPFSPIAMARYNTDGTLDNSFGIGGKVTTSGFSGNKEAYGFSIALQSDGKIVVLGERAIVRYQVDGKLDTTFGDKGKINHGSGNCIKIQPDGKLIVGGQAGYPPNDDFGLWRYNTNGSIDSTFSSDGWARVDFTSSDTPISLSLQHDGKIIIAGYCYTPTIDFALARLNNDGTLDQSFGDSGKVITEVGNYGDRGYAVALQSDGKIVLAGTSLSPGTSYDFALVRYHSDGSLDSTFDFDGKAITAIGTSDDFANAVTIQNDNKIVLTGTSVGKFALARYQTNGALDSTFGSNGTLTTNVGTIEDGAAAVAIQRDGKIVVAGFSYNTDRNSDFAVLRFTSGMVGVQHNTVLSELNIYPNPSSGIFNLVLTGQPTDMKVCVYDVLGNCVWQENYQNESAFKIDLSKEAKGIYFAETIIDNKRSMNKIVFH